MHRRGGAAERCTFFTGFLPKAAARVWRRFSFVNFRIAAHSKRQALDWSLALVSQGIESILDCSGDAGWGLLVEESDQARACAVIRQYQKENRRWPWQQKILLPEISFDWGSLAWVFLIGVFFWLSGQTASLRDAGMMRSSAVARGEWWRLFTAIFLHADLAHLASNAVIGFVLLSLAMGRCGTGIGLLAALLAGAGGNVASWLVYPSDHQGLGASGMVLGCLGLLAAQSFPDLKHHPKAIKLAVTGVAAGGMLFVLLGLSPGTDVVAHLGGFASGLLLGTLLAFWPQLARHTATNLAAGGIFSLLTVIAWWLALATRR